MRLRKLSTVVTVAFAAALTVSGCSAGTTAGTPETASTPSDSAVVEAVDGDIPLVEGAFGEVPVIHPAKGAEPKELVSKVLIKGDGPEVKATDTLTVNYVGQLWDGKVFDSSFKRGAPAEFPLNQVIPGWTQGLTGKHVGDRVLLLIPSELGYGEQGTGNIPGNATLVFVVDIVKAQSAEEAQKEAEAKKQQAAAEQEKLREELPKVVKSGKEALVQAEKPAVKLPQGITTDNNQQGQPSLEIAKDFTSQGDQKQFILLKGKGPKIEANDGFYYNMTVAVPGEAAKSTWSDDGNQIQWVQKVGDPGSEAFAGMTVGTRVLDIITASDGRIAVRIVDIMGIINN